MTNDYLAPSLAPQAPPLAPRHAPQHRRQHRPLHRAARGTMLPYAPHERTLTMAWTPLDDEFPLGDGVADLTADVVCPYCGEALELGVDPGGGPLQEYVEDCEVCCRPMQVTVRWDDSGAAHAYARTDEDG
jgi:hypothetical protein